MLDRTNIPQAQTCSVLHELTENLEQGGPQHRLRILQRVTDLFMAGASDYSDAQIAVFDDILQQLTADIENKARARLARKVAVLERAPRRLVRTFAFDDDIEVAAPVLVRSPELSDADLVENARRKSQAHLLAIAQRLKLSEAVTDVLIERGDSRVVRRVVRNRGARFSLPGYDRLIVRAQGDRKLSLALARRRDLPRQCYLKLVESASASVRARLQREHPEFAAAIQASIDELATRLQEEARAVSRQHRLAARKLDSRLRHRPATDADVHASAHAEDFEKSALSLARLGSFSLDLVERALLDKGCDMVLVLAKAAGCSWTTARALLQLRDADRHLADEDLARCSEQYKKLKREVARNVVRFREQRLRVNARDARALDNTRERQGGDEERLRLAFA